MLVLEDDIALSSSLPRLTSSIRALLAGQQWDFVYFGHYATGGIPLASRDMNESELSFHLWAAEILAAEFYGVSGRILRRLITHLEKLSCGQPGDQEAGPMPVDGAYNIFRRNNPDIRCLIACPRLGRQLPSRSDITPHLLDNFTLIRPIGNVLRKYKQLGTQRRL